MRAKRKFPGQTFAVAGPVFLVVDLCLCSAKASRSHFVIASIDAFSFNLGRFSGVFTMVELSRAMVTASFEPVRPQRYSVLGTAVSEFNAQRALRSARYGTLRDCQLSY